MKSGPNPPLTLLIDLDRTLYPPRAGLQEAGDHLLTAFVARTVGLTLEEAHKLRRGLWAQYGTSARGLEVEYGIPQSVVYAHCIELLEPADYVWPRPQVGEMLASLGCPAWICTNSTELYARRVLAALGLTESFAGLITIETMGWQAKPAPEAYAAALAHAGVAAAQAVFVDDAINNVQGAAAVGIQAVLCHPRPREPWTPHLRDILELPACLQALSAAPV
ncbi:MAG TPA: HAD-IA family hydrolase [Armatimonadota bacterium]|jgi:putative hydrolase of the HAD superfamily